MWRVFKESIQDVCGAVDAKLLTAFVSALVIFSAVIIYYLWGLELPDKYWYTFSGFVGLGTGLGSAERITQFLTHKHNTHEKITETGPDQVP